MKLTKQQTEILVGTVLGDGFLQKTGTKNARLRLEHSDKQKEYLLWKGTQMSRLFQGKPTFLSRVHPKSGETYSYARWQSSASPELGVWQRYFYKEGKKTISADIGKYLTPLSLAVWYMDDGYLSPDKSSFIYLGRVSKEESEILQNAITKNFSIEAKIYDKKNKGFALYFPVEETKKLHALIKSFIHSSMLYKLDN